MKSPDNMKRSPLKRKTPLRKQSKRMAKDYDEYMRKRSAFLLEHDRCQVWLEVKCYREDDFGDRIMAIAHGCPCSTEIHHKCCGKNRKATYLREDTWMAVSTWGHNFIHMNPKLAYERGWLLKTIPEEPKCED